MLFPLQKITLPPALQLVLQHIMLSNAFHYHTSLNSLTAVHFSLLSQCGLISNRTFTYCSLNYPPGSGFSGFCFMSSRKDSCSFLFQLPLDCYSPKHWEGTRGLATNTEMVGRPISSDRNSKDYSPSPGYKITNNDCWCFKIAKAILHEEDKTWLFCFTKYNYCNQQDSDKVFLKQGRWEEQSVLTGVDH